MLFCSPKIFGKKIKQFGKIHYIMLHQILQNGFYNFLCIDLGVIGFAYCIFWYCFVYFTPNILLLFVEVIIFHFLHVKKF